jgi:hypothetical protein
VAIVFQNAGTTTFAPFGNPDDVNLPTSIGAGDLLLMLLSFDGNGTDTLTATGWTFLTRSNCSAPDGQTEYVAYRVADGGEGSTISVSGNVSLFSGTMAWVGRFTGVDTTTPMDATAVTSNRSTADASPSAVDITGITTVTDNAMVVGLVSVDWNLGGGSGAVLDSWASGFTEIADANNSGNWVHYGVATKILTSAGASGTITATATLAGQDAGWAGHSVALRPAADVFVFDDDGFTPKAQPDPGTLMAVW